MCVRVLCVCVHLDGFSFQGHPNETDSLTINPGADVSDPRNKHARAAAPTPSSARYPSRGTASSDLVPGPSASHQDDGLGTSMDGTYSEVQQAKTYNRLRRLL